MTLPVQFPISPMLAKAVKGVPPADSVDGGLSYEPKWDGFRMIVFRDGDDITLQSRNGEDLTYCFPEILEPLRASTPTECVLDGELVIAHDGRLWFEELTGRIRPRKEAGGWKIDELASQFPVEYVAFDLLALGTESLMGSPFRTRRGALEATLAGSASGVHVTPSTGDDALAATWFGQFEGAGLDGLVCKPWNGTYQPGVRSLLKVKHSRTADVVVAGWRAHKNPGPDGSPVVGSLLLGLYDDKGLLHHVGVASSFTAVRRRELIDLLAEFESNVTDHPWAHRGGDAAGGEGRRPGGVSRWTGGKDLSFQLLRPDLVCEVAYDHMEGDRFRHTTQFQRWRPDRTPQSCTYDQLERPVHFDLAHILPN